MEVKKNDIFTVTITDTGNDGEGIGRVSVPGGKAACAADAAQADTLSADTLPADTLPRTRCRWTNCLRPGRMRIHCR